MDGSGSVGNCEFQRGKAAIKNLMKSENAVAIKNGFDEKYAAVTFSSSARVNFKFLPYSTAEQRLRVIQFPGGATNTQAGLAEAMKLFLESLTGICFAVTKFPPVRKLCGNFPEIPFTAVFKVFYLQFTELLTDLENKSGFAVKPFVFPRAPTKLSRKKEKKRREKRVSTGYASGYTATAFSYLTPRRYTSMTATLINRMYVLFVPGGRFAFRKNVLLITDGQSNVQPQLTKANADKLKRLGVHIYVFAVGSYIPGIGEMVQVAGSSSTPTPAEGYLFRINGYHQLWEFSKLVVTKLASTGKYISLSPAPSPC